MSDQSHEKGKIVCFGLKKHKTFGEDDEIESEEAIV